MALPPHSPGRGTIAIAAAAALAEEQRSADKARMSFLVEVVMAVVVITAVVVDFCFEGPDRKGWLSGPRGRAVAVLASLAVAAHAYGLMDGALVFWAAVGPAMFFVVRRASDLLIVDAVPKKYVE